jgi:hypothetical protein
LLSFSPSPVITINPNQTSPYIYYFSRLQKFRISYETLSNFHQVRWI